MLNRALAFVLVLGTFWDFVTAFAGTLIFLGAVNWFSFGTSFIASAIICVLNFYTTRVWRKYEEDEDRNTESIFITWVVRAFWLGAIIFNFCASFTSILTYGFQQEENNTPGARLVIIFITALIVISPMTLGKVWEERRKRELAEQKHKQYQS